MSSQSLLGNTTGYTLHCQRIRYQHTTWAIRETYIHTKYNNMHFSWTCRAGKMYVLWYTAQTGNTKLTKGIRKAVLFATGDTAALRCPWSSPGVYPQHMSPVTHRRVTMATQLPAPRSCHFRLPLREFLITSARRTPQRFIWRFSWWILSSKLSDSDIQYFTQYNLDHRVEIFCHVVK